MNAGATYRVRPHREGGWTYDLTLLAPAFESHGQVIEGDGPQAPTPEARFASRQEADTRGKMASLCLAAEAVAQLVAECYRTGAWRSPIRD